MRELGGPTCGWLIKSNKDCVLTSQADISNQLDPNHQL